METLLDIILFCGGIYFIYICLDLLIYIISLLFIAFFKPLFIYIYENRIGCLIICLIICTITILGLIGICGTPDHYIINLLVVVFFLLLLLFFFVFPTSYEEEKEYEIIKQCSEEIEQLKIKLVQLHKEFDKDLNRQLVELNKSYDLQPIYDKIYSIHDQIDKNFKQIEDSYEELKEHFYEKIYKKERIINKGTQISYAILMLIPELIRLKTKKDPGIEQIINSLTEFIQLKLKSEDLVNELVELNYNTEIEALSAKEKKYKELKPKIDQFYNKVKKIL
ncbi:MAG: hypothetical protein LBD46_07790 [Endomicrobium sp.]|jgi:hypothetical protein|nr:hypothetical protein [Endomicrobium sp.]